MSAEQPRAGYILPYHASEADRLDFQHRLLTRTFGGLYRAPLNLERSRRVLDIGCGTGAWAKEFATANPHIEVVGIDIKVWPSWTTAPKNCTFVQSSFEEQSAWSAIDGRFDLIIGRFIVVAVKDWRLLIERCVGRLQLTGSIAVEVVLI